MNTSTGISQSAGAVPPARAERVALGRLLWVAPLAGVVAALANLIVYAVGVALGAIPADLILPQYGGPITPVAVVASSVGGAIAAAIVFGLIGRFVPRPVRTFRIVAAVGLLLSLVVPATLAGAPVSLILALELMHIAAAVVIVGLLTTLTRAR